MKKATIKASADRPRSGRIAIVLAFGALTTSVSAGEADAVRVKFQPGADHATVASVVKGRGEVLYKLDARSGQFLTVDLKPENPSANYNIYIPGRGPGDEALFTSATGGNHYTGQLYKDGDHTISVFLVRAAARRNESSKFEITFRVTDQAPGGSAAPVKFDKRVAYRGIRFHVTSPQSDAENQFTITPSGLSVSNEPITIKVKGNVVDVMTDDMDGDDSPEAAVIVESPNGKRRKAHVFTTFAGKSFGQVNGPVVNDKSLLDGYHGGDEYQFVENTFIRRFPLHGKTRQLQFKLKPGEAMKQLVLDCHSDF